MITAEQHDGKIVELRPGEAICGRGFYSITITREPLDKPDPFLTYSEAEHKRMLDWLANLLTCRLMRKPKEKK